MTGLARKREGADRLRVAGVEPVFGDVMDAAGLRGALHGRSADAVIHQATAITKTPTFHRDLDRTDALRDEGTRNLLRAARELGATRFVTQSFFLGYGWRDHGEVFLSEEHPFGELGQGAFDRHLRSLTSNEDQVLGADGIEGIALRYGLFYGPEPSTRSMMDRARRRRLPVPSPSATVTPIHIEDVATATVAALDHGRPAQAYNIVDDRPVTMAEFISGLAAAAGAPAPRRVPGWLLRATPYLYALVVSTRIHLDNGKAKRELGWSPAYPTIWDGFAALT